MAGNRNILHSFHHLLIGGILILKGSEKYHHHHLLGGLIFSFGVIIILIFIYFIVKKVHSKGFSIMVHLFEAFACLFTAYIFYEDGKKYLPYFFLLASLGFFASIFLLIRKNKKIENQY